MSRSDRVLLEIVVAAPADVVWRALREPNEIRRWFGWDYAGLAEEIAFMFVDEAAASESDRVLRIGGGNDRFVLVPQGEQTLVRVIRSAPSGEGGWEDVYDDETEGWTSFVEQLRFALERHRGEERRTLYLSGRATETTPVPAEAVGIVSLRGVEEGAPFSIVVGPGDELTGRIWYRSRRQLGLTVNEWGDGLLIVTERPATEASPFGGGQALLTTYGLDDVAFQLLCARWTQWWSERYSKVTVQPESVDR